MLMHPDQPEAFTRQASAKRIVSETAGGGTNLVKPLDRSHAATKSYGFPSDMMTDNYDDR